MVWFLMAMLVVFALALWGEERNGMAAFLLALAIACVAGMLSPQLRLWVVIGMTLWSWWATFYAIRRARAGSLVLGLALSCWGTILLGVQA